MKNFSTTRATTQTPITNSFLRRRPLPLNHYNIYPEQYAYMLDLKRALDAKGHCLLEMPTGTGKTIALFSLITSYVLSKPNSPLKLLYCTRTIHEMEKTLAELRLLHDYQLRPLALGLSSRKNLCVNPRVLAAENRDSVDVGCRKLTASWVSALAAKNPSMPTCEFFEQYERAGSAAVLLPGVYTLQFMDNVSHKYIPRITRAISSLPLSTSHRRTFVR